jgi:protein-tyrosine phosphatase
MTPYWVEREGHGRIAIVPRPRGGDWLEDELRAMREAGVDVLVSMLTPPEQAELGLADEARLCELAGIEFLGFPVADRETSESMARFRAFVSGLRQKLAEGKLVASHCRASIGRASLVLACLMTDEGLSAAEAFARLSKARGTKVPDTQEQVRWVERYFESLEAG